MINQFLEDKKGKGVPSSSKHVPSYLKKANEITHERYAEPDHDDVDL